MTGAICYLSLVAVRAEPSGKAEMVNQLLFGDIVEIVDNFDHWCKIRTLFDSYEGWCDQKQIHQLTDETLEVLKGSSLRVVTDITGLLSTQGKPGLPVVMGSNLYTLSNGLIAGPHGDYHLTEGESNTPELLNTEEIAETASLYLNAPYLWGGRSPFGIDCSGLVQIVFKMKGIILKRDAAQQAKQGSLINLIEESRSGDVAFFDNEEGKIIHTGIITGRGSIIHASGEVRVDPLDHHGIFNKKAGKYSHKLRVIKRYAEI
ncbi:MAG: C40 family peptidase [Bacteroidota bacterium]